MTVTWKKIAYEENVILKSFLDAAGDIIYASGDNTPAILTAGTDTYVLTLVAGVPDWVSPAAPGAHKDTHDPEDGGDPLDCATPAELVGVQAAGEGSAHEFARADHDHQVQESFADDHLVTINAADIADGDIARFTASGGLEGKTPAEVAALMALDDIGVPDAGVDFDLQQAVDLVVFTVANETARDALAAAATAVGQLCFATGELSLSICTVSEV